MVDQDRRSSKMPMEFRGRAIPMFFLGTVPGCAYYYITIKAIAFLIFFCGGTS